MYNGKEENIQKALDNLCAAVMETAANGTEEHNHIIGLKYMEKDRRKYIRVIWSDDPDRDDGYYDINVDCCSLWGMITTVMEWLKKRL